MALRDAPEVERILTSVHAAVGAVPIGSRWTAQQIVDRCTGDGLVSCAANGQIAAFIFYTKRIDAWEIEFLASALDARGQGRMSGLIQYLLKLRPEQTALWLEVHEANSPARKLYKKMGFIEVGRRAAYYPDGGAAILYNYG